MDKTIAICIPIALLIIFFIIRVVIAVRAHIDEKNEEISRRFLEEYILGIKHKYPGEMEMALTHMIAYCPHACSMCIRRRECYRCDDRYGWRSILVAKYGKVVSVDDVSKKLEDPV